MKKWLCLILVLCMMVPFAASAQELPELTYLLWDSAPFTEEELAEVEAQVGAKINVINVPFDEYYTKLNTLIAAKETPDVFEISEYLAVEWGEKGLSQDLTPLFRDLGVNLKDTYLAASLYGSDGKVYGMTSGLTCIMLFYNRDLFDKYGIPYPSNDPANPITWDEYVKIAQQLTRDVNDKTPLDEGFDPFSVVSYGTKTTTWTFSLAAFLFSNNTGMFNKDGMSLALGTDEAKQVLSEMCKLSNEYGCAPDAVISASLPGNVQMFKDGMLGMCVEGSFMIGSYVNENANFGIAPLPCFAKPATATWSAANAVSAATQHPAEATKLIQLLTNRLGSQYPSQIASYEPDAFAVWADSLKLTEEDKIWMPGYLNSDASVIHEAVYIKNYGTINDEVISPALDKLWAGEIDVDQLAAETAEKAEGLFGGAYLIFAE